MFNPNFMDRFLVDYQFEEDISEDYLRYLKDQITKVRINQVKRTVEIWATQPETGPIHELIDWLTLLKPTLSVTELDLHGNTARVLEFRKCSLVDHELIYSYEETAVAKNYLIWAYTDSQF